MTPEPRSAASPARSFAESGRTNSLVLHPPSQAKQPTKPEFRIPEMEEVWPDLPQGRRASVRPCWRRSDSLTRVGAELVADKSPDAGDDTMEMPEHAWSKSSLFHEAAVPHAEAAGVQLEASSKTGAFESLKGSQQLGESGQSVGGLTFINNKTWTSPEQGAPMPARASPLQRNQAPECLPWREVHIGDPARWTAARTSLPSLSEEVEQIRRENALSVVRDWAKAGTGPKATVSVA
ncbi:unnamed protein product [Effrenium voratum]|nr:unnamed protein product [Effrenium voratum]